MLILGIDTSCDETSIALIRSEKKKIKILSNVVSSQVKIHSKYGGVYPLLAKREHLKNLPLVFKRATRKIKIFDIDLIGVTMGPGLEPCLWQGINFAKKISEKIKKPLLGVNHIEAHIFSPFLEKKWKFLWQKNIFPAISLVVSGGHTQLILVKEIGKYKLIGETRDDAAGECLDKVARLLDLGYPGGPVIEKLAKLKIKDYKIKLPRPMIYQKNYDFSFAGLKTAVLYDFQSRDEKERKSKKYKIAMAKEVQQAVIDVLIFKTLRAVEEFKVNSVILGGGVAANKELRKQLAEKINKERPKSFCFFSEPKYATDNGAMVAAIAFLKFQKGNFSSDKIEATADLGIEN